jgi:hypothetical protein
MLQDECKGLPVFQGLPQDTQHFAWASYDQNTPCSDVVDGNVQPNSYGETVRINFEDNSIRQLPGFTYNALHTYTVCSDVTWSQHRAFLTEEKIGPVDTFLWFYNPCESNATVTFNISRLPDREGVLPVCLSTCALCDCLCNGSAWLCLMFLFPGICLYVSKSRSLLALHICSAATVLHGRVSCSYFLADVHTFQQAEARTLRTCALRMQEALLRCTATSWRPRMMENGWLVSSSFAVKRLVLFWPSWVCVCAHLASLVAAAAHATSGAVDVPHPAQEVSIHVGVPAC